MEVYILDSGLYRTDVVESYESMIWAEKYAAFGDFQLDIDPALAEPALQGQGTFIKIDKSQYVGCVDSVENKFQENGKRLLVIKGKTLEAKMRDRPNGYPTVPLVTEPIKITTGSQVPAAALRTLFASICGPTAAVTTDRFSPYIQATTYSPTSGRMGEPIETPLIQTSLGDLYETIRQVCELYRLGFRLICPNDDGKLYFEIYTGYDRTSAQSTLPAVIFSPMLDNLTDTTELTVSETYKNVAHVYAPAYTTAPGYRVVYAGTTDASTASFARKVLVVDASDITDVAGTTLNNKMDQRGAEELAKCRITKVFDGQIPQTNSYVYGTDYMLGDLVEKRSESGDLMQMRVTEQIFTSNSEGEKNYPTLTVDSLVTPGAWDAVSASKYWDIYTTEVWDSM